MIVPDFPNSTMRFGAVVYKSHGHIVAVTPDAYISNLKNCDYSDSCISEVRELINVVYLASRKTVKCDGKLMTPEQAARYLLRKLQPKH
jgi:hypothetical protein